MQFVKNDTFFFSFLGIFNNNDPFKVRESKATFLSNGPSFARKKNVY